MKHRRPWTDYEDQILKFVRESEPSKRWGYVTNRMQQQFNIYGRSEKQCRDRYQIYIKSKTEMDNWDSQKEKKMFSLHKKYGNRWGLIATHFQRKNGPFIKNQFYSRLRRSLRKINQLINSYYKKQFEEFSMKMAYNVAMFVDKKIKDRKQNSTKESSGASGGSSPLQEGEDYQIIHKLLLFSDDSQPKMNSSFFVENSFLEDIINQLIQIKEGRADENEKQQQLLSFEQRQKAVSNDFVYEPARKEELSMIHQQNQMDQATCKEEYNFGKKSQIEKRQQNIPISDQNWRAKLSMKMNKSQKGEGNRLSSKSDLKAYHQSQQKVSQKNCNYFIDQNDRPIRQQIIIGRLNSEKQKDQHDKKSDGDDSKKNSEQSKKYSKSSNPSKNNNSNQNSFNNNSNDDSKKDSKDSSKPKSLTPLMSINSKPSENPNSSNMEMRQINSDDKVSKNNSQVPFLNDSTNNKSKFEHVLSLANNYEQESDREYSVISKIKQDLRNGFFDSVQDSYEKRARTEYMEYENFFVLMQAQQNSYP